MDFISNLTNAQTRTGLTEESLEQLEKVFRQALGDKQELSFDDFKKIVHSKNTFFAERVFQIFDRDKSGSVSLSEFLESMQQFAGQTPNDKFKFLFKVYDIDENGFIQQEELHQVLQACMEENGMKFSKEQIEDLTQTMFDDADSENQGNITYEALKAQLERHSGLLENLSISIDRWLVPPEPLEQSTPSIVSRLKKLVPYQLSLPYIKNNYVFLSFLVVFFCINISLFISRAVEYRTSNAFLIIARACGQCLNFNCMLVMVMTLRQCITFLRTRGAGSFLPLDQHLYLHKMCGWIIFALSSVHAVMHLANFGLVLQYQTKPGEFNQYNCSFSELMTSDCPKHMGLVPGWANPTGILISIILTIMVVCSQPFVRKSGYFQVFYWTHFLYVGFFTLMIFHAPHFWHWFIIPGIIFVIERVYQTINMRTGRGHTYVSSGVLLPSKVTNLIINRPVSFQFHPGDYVFVNIPAIAKYEWHPFTLSSAPEQDGALWLHIRAVGEWTNRLHSHFERQKQQQQLEQLLQQHQRQQQRQLQYGSDMHTQVKIENGEQSGNMLEVRTDSGREVNSDKGETEQKPRRLSRLEDFSALAITQASGPPLEIYIDGPYGAPSSHIFRAQHAVLIATGIGVTPFASILQSIMHKYLKARHSCPKCQHSWTSVIPRSVMNLKKVDFFWINRDQRSFEWFVDLLSRLEIEQAEQGGVLDRFLDMHMYITSALQKTDMKAVGLQLALDLLHERSKRDLITGLKTRTNAGRPNWDKVFRQLSTEGRGRITVFYCGPPTLARTLRYKCDEFGFDFRKEIF